MKHFHVLFLLVSIFSIYLSWPEQNPKENKLGIVNRYIDFTGKVEMLCSLYNNVYTLYFYFLAEITGFTKPYSFILYTAGKYAYMRCTIPVSTNINSNITCTWSPGKFYVPYTIEFQKEFPEIEDCQVSYWEKVKPISFYYNYCNYDYNKYFSFTSESDPLCYSNTQSIIQVIGKLGNYGSSTTASQYSFSVPVFVDDYETYMSCTLNRIEDSTYGYKCIVRGGKKLRHYYTIVSSSGIKILLQIKREFNLLDCQNPSRMIRFINYTQGCPIINQKKSVYVKFNAYIFGFYRIKENFRLQLTVPSYAYLECIIPYSPYSSSEKVIECSLDINKFPLYSNRKLTLPTNFPDIDCEIQYWNTITK